MISKILGLILSSAVRRVFLATAALLGGFVGATHAQPPGTGVITGRVLNSATNEYIRNAEVRVQGTAITAVTEDGGYYRLNNVPLEQRP
jgi:iron complex outermembrane receptor protein